MKQIRCQIEISFFLTKKWIFSLFDGLGSRESCLKNKSNVEIQKSEWKIGNLFLKPQMKEIKEIEFMWPGQVVSRVFSDED